MIEFPFFNMQQLNLDWIIDKIKGMLSFLPDDGTAGQILRRTADGAEWSDGGGGAVDSVNGQTGTVVLDADDVGLGNVDNVRQYSAQNQPPYPVTSVNGQTGDVNVQTATDAQVTTAVNTWLGENVAQETGYVLDSTLTMSNAAPPASAVGDLKSAFDATLVFPRQAQLTGLGYENSALLYLKPGDNFTVKTADGNPFTFQRLNIADLDGAVNTYYTLTNVASPFSATIGTASTKHETYCVYITGGTAKAITVVNNTSVYPTARKISEIESELSELNTDNLSINMLNPENVKDGIHSQTNGANYGTITANSDYCYTELFPVSTGDTFYVFADFIGSSTVYVTFFANGAVVGKQNGYNQTVTIPQGVDAFCATFAKSKLPTSMIYSTYRSEYIPFGKYEDSKNISAAVAEKIRLDRTIISGYNLHTTSAGSSVYPFSALESLFTSAAVKIPESGVSYRNNGNFTPRVVFTDTSNNVISYIDISPYSVGTLTIPSGAAFFFYIAGVSHSDGSELCFVEGQTPPAEVYPFDGISVKAISGIDKTPISGKKILFIGDSITAGLGYEGGWVRMIQTKYGAICTNEGHSGWPVGIIPDRTDNLLSLLPNMGNDYDIVALSGGYNDMTHVPGAALGEVTPYTYSEIDTSTFCGSMESYIRTARNKWQDSKICYILTMHKEWTDTTTTAKQIQYWNIIRQICNKYSIPVLDLYNNAGIVGVEVSGVTDAITAKYYKDADGTHPNQAGYEYLTPMIAQFLMQL